MTQPPGRRFLLLAGLAGVVAFGLLFGPRPGEADNPDDNGKTSAEKKGDSTKIAGKKGATEKIDPLSVNATCYVCHMTFVREKISKVHFKEKVTCVKCHGVSAAHANDEDIGATKPDIMYKRHKVDAMCRECHEDHDVAATDVIQRFVERKPAKSPVVCTDCHGMHKIQAPEEE